MRIVAAAIAALALTASHTAIAQQSPPAAPAKKSVKTQDELPRYDYPVATSASALLVSDDATFAPFAAKVRHDVDATLAEFDIADHATQRRLLGVRLSFQLLEHEDRAALATIAQIRALQDKPDARLTSGLVEEAIVKARRETGASSGPAYQAAFGRLYASSLAPLPWAVVGNRLKEQKRTAEIVSRGLLEGNAKASYDPGVAKSHMIGDDTAWTLVNDRYAIAEVVPVRDRIAAAIAPIVAANTVKKPDIWAAREVTLTPADHPTPVTVAIWDEGVDLALFPGRAYTDPARGLQPPFNAHGLAFDIDFRPSTGDTRPLSAARRAQYPVVFKDLKGFSDLQAAIDSPEAGALRRKLSTIPADAAPRFFEDLQFYGAYIHGTHVAGIASRGNPAIRLAPARLEWDWRNVPAVPTDALVGRQVAAYRTYIAWFRAHGVRVVNMSWGGSAAGYEGALEANGVGKDAAERKAMGRHFYLMDRNGLYEAMKGAPDVLFVVSAGNSNNDNAFDEVYPSSFALPNMIAVGAVDQAGDEASFTTYGKNVRVDANGYDVDSVVPGGRHLALSGTSMAAPNVTNLAAKLIALDPKLTPAQTIDLIVRGATASADGRRHNIDPKASVALLKRRVAAR